MAAKSLRNCLISLGSTGTNHIEYIETYYSENLDYLDNVCNASKPGSTFNKALTETQQDSCHKDYRSPDIGTNINMYPSHCREGWLGNDCTNSCYHKNYDGFYCTGNGLLEFSY